MLASHPEVEACVLAEMNDVLGDRLPAAADVPKLAYTESVIKETMRLYPPAIGTLARQAVEDVDIGGYRLRKGAIIRALSYFLHHDPRWFPDPERFDPQRFAPGRAEHIPPHAYFPFGAGPRVCIGNMFAMTEMTLVLATLLPRYRLALAPGQGPPQLSPAHDRIPPHPASGASRCLKPYATRCSSQINAARNRAVPEAHPGRAGSPRVWAPRPRRSPRGARRLRATSPRQRRHSFN
jgi:cytochrome P450